ncbi:hypothetical protein DFH08DRAFT_851982 [Mycena albidolilacea]|uniref:Uncharacterized protein n=1 Tax=Mycena albidolilacea TaxID=1033008 RepID=A0AAD7EYR8_9AGAR|nr:hypothetical protein DFH08DRAFT_851982 [Mycena albidolilacea]
MFFNKSLLAAAVLIGSATAFTGTATLGFGGTTTCGCPASNGPVAVSVPLALAAGQRCCFDTVTAFYNSKNVTAIYAGNYDDGVGTENIELSDFAFGVLEDNSSQTTLSPVTWAFD